jgi:hypothetical protein
MLRTREEREELQDLVANIQSGGDTGTSSMVGCSETDAQSTTTTRLEYLKEQINANKRAVQAERRRVSLEVAEIGERVDNDRKRARELQSELERVLDETSVLDQQISPQLSKNISLSEESCPSGVDHEGDESESQVFNEEYEEVVVVGDNETSGGDENNNDRLSEDLPNERGGIETDLSRFNTDASDMSSNGCGSSSSSGSGGSMTESRFSFDSEASSECHQQGSFGSEDDEEEEEEPEAYMQLPLRMPSVQSLPVSLSRWAASELDALCDVVQFLQTPAQFLEQTCRSRSRSQSNKSLDGNQLNSITPQRRRRSGTATTTPDLHSSLSGSETNASVYSSNSSRGNSSDSGGSTSSTSHKHVGNEQTEAWIQLSADAERLELRRRTKNGGKAGVRVFVQTNDLSVSVMAKSINTMVVRATGLREPWVLVFGSGRGKVKVNVNGEADSQQHAAAVVQTWAQGLNLVAQLVSKGSGTASLRLAMRRRQQQHQQQQT